MLMLNVNIGCFNHFITCGRGVFALYLYIKGILSFGTLSVESACVDHVIVANSSEARFQINLGKLNLVEI